MINLESVPVTKVIGLIYDSFEVFYVKHLLVIEYND